MLDEGLFLVCCVSINQDLYGLARVCGQLYLALQHVGNWETLDLILARRQALTNKEADVAGSF